jgi:Xaa-Pro aminopeptidase
MVVSHLPNVRYLSGFTGSNGLLVVTRRSTTLFTDPRYDIQSAQECDCPARAVTGPTWRAAIAELRRRRVRRLALESARLSHDTWTLVEEGLGPRARLTPVRELVETLRMVKSPDEIEKVRRSVRLCSQAFAQVVKWLRPGRTELEIAAELDHRMRRLGAEAAAFETIVAVGERAALPHASPGETRFEPGRSLLIDMGACLNGYASDMTRVVHCGPPPARLRRIYDAVLEAQLAGIAAVKPGATAHDVDAAARNALKKRKLDQYFTHSTGHGLGLEIHESPRLGANSKTVLEPGMTITVEPGVYIEGFGGVRIEDTVLVSETGVDVLTPTSKQFLEIPS